MLKVFGRSHGSTKSLNALDELAEIQDAMSAVTYIMNDNIDEAETHLSKGSSPFHQLGKGVCIFIRATLGFEQEVMREASTILSNTENAAYESQRRAHRNPNAYNSPIYPPGTEYAVTLAEAQLMSAIVGVLNESLTEAVKSFYKLRKAYLTLEGVMDAEKKFLQTRSTSSLGSTTSGEASRPLSRTSGKSTGSPVPKPPGTNDGEEVKEKQLAAETNKKSAKDNDDEDDFDFVDADEDRQVETPIEYMGHLDLPADKGASVNMDNTKKDVHIKSSSAPDLPSKDTQPATTVPNVVNDFDELTLTDTIKESKDISVYGDHPIDTFIISGSNFCFGILLLIISLVPPAFATLLKIVGFKGDRERGIQMLWQATKFHNIHGAMAGLVIFGYYNGITGFCDIIPQSGEGSYPKERCRLLLAEMRNRYPKSHLWLLEEARSFAEEKQLEKAVDFMAKAGETPLKQLEALGWFERSLNTMYLHEYEETATSFLKCITLNNWSHGLYYYICAASYVELYRRNKDTDPDAAGVYKTKAVQYFEKVAPNTGKKRFMARQLPFDVFVNRKMSKWNDRAKEWSCDMIDAIGVSPIEEMIYFWNGYKRMRNEHLDQSLANLAWSESASNPHWAKESLDEKAILAVLRAAVIRSKGDSQTAKDILQKEIISVDRQLFKGHNLDSWTAPIARYEMAACIWKEADANGTPEQHPEMLEECKKWLVEVSGWESYDLDARIGMKVTAAKGTLRRYGVDC
ncbi:hypothetical protein DM02DRAFT_617548 [Periconia macrospinosa]|uniref:Inclusion body clearance protein IML2 n=1 Tax=Periconia macrospinosa TaxID=97972 RepID=A0A2V1DCQ4_9PLEO|nr:hypothetical protein DM02DRAFT_617548 [Periconia macrospinosa]